MMTVWLAGIEMVNADRCMEVSSGDGRILPAVLKMREVRRC